MCQKFRKKNEDEEVIIVNIEKLFHMNSNYIILLSLASC